MSKRLNDKQELIIASAGTLSAGTTWFYTSSIQITGETPSGQVDDQNDTFNLQNYPVTKNTVSITINAGTQITDDGEGNLNDGTSDVGTIDYNTGEIIFNTQPTTGDTILQDYSYDVLIDVSRYKGVLLEFKVTFSDNSDVSGDVEFYITNSIDGTDFNATLEQQEPLRFVSPIQHTTVTVVEKYFCPLDYNLSIGVKNNDQSYGVDISCEYKLVNL